MEEIWKSVKNYDGFYEVSNRGNLRSLDRVSATSAGVIKRTKGKVLKNTFKNNGYLTVMFSVQGISKRCHVHRIVAEAFIGNPLIKPMVNHKNGNKKDNCADNLEWVTHCENVKHAVKNGLITVGENKSYCKLSSEKVKAIRRLFRINPKFHKVNLAKKLGVRDTTIHKIIKNKRWKHLL